MEKIKMTEWQEVKLEDVCIQITDGVHNTVKDDFDGEYYLLSCKNLKYGSVFIGENERKINKTTLENLRKRTKTEKGDVLLSSVGTIGETAIVKEDNPVFEFQRSVAIFKPDKNKIISRFLFYFFNSKKEVLKHMAEGAVQQCLFITPLKDFKISLPPLEIQRKIAGILGALDDKIEVLRAQNKTLEKMAQAVFQSWFVDFDIVRAKAAGLPAADICKKYHITPDIYDLFPSAFSADNLPLGWEKKKLGDLAFNASETHTAQGVEKLIFINTSDVENGAFLHNKYSVRSEMPGQAKKSIKENDILYSEIRPINKHFAFVNFDSKDYIVSTKFMIIRSFDINNVFYIYFFLTLKETLNSFQALAENRSGTFPQITFESISKTEIVFSNRELHWYFSDYLKKTYTKIFENEKQIRTLEQTRDTLLPQLISGKIEV